MKYSIQVLGYGSAFVEKAKRSVKMNLASLKDNKCYFNFKVILDNAAEVIYESKAVPPGQSIGSFDLTRPLAEGGL